MQNLDSTAGSPDTTLARLEQFAWLVDHTGKDRSPERLEILWDWAKEMAFYQEKANRIGKPVEYVQRGKTLRIIKPQTRDATFLDGGPFPSREPTFVSEDGE